MRRKNFVSLLAAFAIVVSVSFAFTTGNYNGPKTITTTNYATINKLVTELTNKYGKSEVLVVLDIDNTILTSTTDLGGDVWYQWQREKLNIKPTEEQKVACLFEDAIGLLYELNPMYLTEPEVPSFIDEWQLNEIAVFALTSRSPKYRAATERELTRSAINFTKTAPRPAGEKLPVYRYKTKRELSYMQGIMMTTGMNKGIMLKHILEKTSCEYKAIVFVDDSEKNVSNLEAEFANTQIDMTIFHYTKVIEDRKAANGGLELTQEQADKMHHDWLELNKMLKVIFPVRYKGGCLGE